MPGGGIFISYRRDDSAGFAGRLYDRLAQRFGADRIFMDIDTIAPGHEFRADIDEALTSCDACVVLIGRDWLTITATDGTRRLDDPTDFVRLEVATAIRHRVPVFPVLVDKASAPAAASLPDDIRPLAGRQAIELSNERWNYDMSRLLLALEGTPHPPPWWKRPAVIAGGATVILAVAAGSWLATRSGSDGAATEVPLLRGTYEVSMTLTDQTTGSLGENELWLEPSPRVGVPSASWDRQPWVFSPPRSWTVPGREMFHGTLEDDGSYTSSGKANCGVGKVDVARHLVPRSTDPPGPAVDTFSGTLTIHWDCDATGTFDATFEVRGIRPA